METEDAIVVALERDEAGGRPQRRTRKPSDKVRQNEGAQDSLDAALLSSKKQTGGTTRGASVKAQKARKDGEAGEDQPESSYADVARTTPTSEPSNVQPLSSPLNTASTCNNTLYCTIDTPRVENEASDQISAGGIRTMVENGVRTEQDNASWRCRAVTKNPRNPHRISIACRDETEHARVKRVVEANLAQGVRILRDDLYPIRVDSVNRTAILDETGSIRPGAAENLGKENDTQIAKIAWLSNWDVPKAYGSMVVYLSKGFDARRLLREGFFYAGGESGYTKVFERRERPKQCYNCQEITDLKAYQCKKTQASFSADPIEAFVIGLNNDDSQTSTKVDLYEYLQYD
ncbi:hypothetical protein DL765_009343 [Monosporascus sp. GIB2]|nr:hypothetical protein DL765_009343 [Monosporascus sp. GIB2]